MLKAKRNKGVSLVELILSIAVLSILSVYVIQMFITSNDLNSKAKVLDQSVLVSESIFEVVESDRTLGNLRNMHLFKHALFDVSEEVVQSIVYLDDAFITIDSQDDAFYILDFKAFKTQALEYEVVNYRIEIHQNDPLELEPIYEIEMQKYY